MSEGDLSGCAWCDGSDGSVRTVVVVVVVVVGGQQSRRSGQ